MRFLRLFSTQHSVCFLSPFPASLPQLFHRCSPFSVFRLPLGVLHAFPFLSSGSRLGSTTQPSVSSVPFFPSSPHSGSSQCRLHLSASADPSSLQPVSMPSFQLWYLAFLQFSFPLLCFCLTGASADSSLLLSKHGCPHSFRLRFGYLSRVMYPEN